MALIKILKNNSGNDKQILNRTLSDQGSITVPSHLWLELASDDNIISGINSGAIVVNDGSSDLSIAEGLELIQRFQFDSADKITFSNNSNNFEAIDVQTAIEESKTKAASISRFSTLFGFDGSGSSGRWLEYYANNASNTSPFIVAEPSELVAISISASSNSTGTITVFKNGSSIATISLSAAKKNRTKGLTLALTDLDELSLQVTSGSISRPTATLFIRTTI